MVNGYTPRWFELFLHPLEPAKTAREIAFLQRQLPPSRFQTVVDVCCGAGRHAHPLAALGYHVIGVDRDRSCVAAANERAFPHETYIEHDVRSLPSLGLSADAVLCLWQSFGYFDAATNRAVFQSMSAMLSPGGRCIVDLYQPAFFTKHQGTRTYDLRAHRIKETTRVAEGRLHVSLLEDSDAPIDTFEWQLFTPEELIALGRAVGLSCILTCTDYDDGQAADPALPRLQYVFEKLAP